jgi:uncharacterized protein
MIASRPENPYLYLVTIFSTIKELLTLNNRPRIVFCYSGLAFLLRIRYLFLMGSSVNYVWDDRKNQLNIMKHGIDFEDARQVFDDPNLLSFYDENHSSQEETRWLSIGRTEKDIMCVVIHLFKDEGGEECIRIISARKADPDEEKQYFSYAGR